MALTTYGRIQECITVYWYGFFPMHALIFKGMSDAIRKKASRPRGSTQSFF